MRFVIVIVAVACAVFCGCDEADQLTCPDRGGGRTNNCPTVSALAADMTDVATGGSVVLSCQASDPDGDDLEFFWKVAAGKISGGGNEVSWRAPDTEGTFTISVVAMDCYAACDTAYLTVRVHKNSPYKLLVDSSRDGGVWWFPQYEGTGFSETEHHQGKRLADYFRNRGYTVDELPRGVTITKSLLNQYDKVLVANGKYYSSGEFAAYDHFVDRKGSVLLLGSEYLRPGCRDLLAERYGVELKGIAYGTIARFADHEITTGAYPFSYIAGSAVLAPESNPDIEVLGWLSTDDYVDLDNDKVRDPDEPTGSAVMGILHHPTAKIFFIGDLNCLETVPQPSVANLVGWINH